MSNFSIERNGVVINATTVSSVTQLPEGTEFAGDLMIYNPGPNAVFVRAGDTGVVATNLSMRILPGEKGAYFKGSKKFLAALAETSAQSITVFVGDGS